MEGTLFKILLWVLFTSAVCGYALARNSGRGVSMFELFQGAYLTKHDIPEIPNALKTIFWQRIVQTILLLSVIITIGATTYHA